MKTVPNILINRMAAGGDVLMTTPIIRKIFQDRGGVCNIDYRVDTENSIYIQNNPYIRKIVPAERGTYPTIDLINQYDVYINLDLVYERNPSMHAVDAYAMYAIGHCNFDRNLELYTTESDKSFARELKGIINNEYIVLHMRKHYWENRNLPTEFWAKLVTNLLEKTKLTIIQVGSMYEPFFSGGNRLIDLRGGTTVPILKEIIEGARLFIGSDSGPSHVAAATETNMLVFYTSVKEEFRRPLRSVGKFIPMIPDIECYGCHQLNTPEVGILCRREPADLECLNRFDLNAATDAAVSLLEDIK
jgi:ADP-heptose:LPS heptosyltransferase